MGGDRALQLSSFSLPPGRTNAPHGPSENWLELGELPSEEELLSKTPINLLFLQNNDIKSKEDYLEKHYRMQRFEAVEPTRLAVEQFARSPDMAEGESVYIYTNVQTQGVVLTKHGAAVRVSFSTERASDAPVDWANSPRLRQGQLVVLSPVDDAFRSKCLVATVAYRFLSGGLWPDLDADQPEPDDTPPRVDLYFSSWSERLLDQTIRYYMLEVKEGHFKSFRHTMAALQTAAFEMSILDKYVLPNDIKEILNQRPIKLRQHTRNTLDKSQLRACQGIIGQELSITQGPPGTGKTFTTVASIDEIIRQINPRKPIIVAAQSNHALDQLLERCLAKDLAVCRLGSRTVSETIEEHSLFNTRQKHKGAVIGIGLAPGAYKDYETALMVLELHLKKTIQRQHNYDETSAESDPLLAWLGWESFTSQSPDQMGQRKVAQKWKTTSNNPQTEGEDKRRTTDPDKPIGPFIELSQRPEPPAARFKSILARTRDLYKVKAQHREELFRYMCNELAKRSRSKLHESFSKFAAACQRLQRSQRDRDNRVIAKTGVQILGCTITGLSIYRQLLCMIGPDVLIIDEASEATEGSIAAALLPSLKHLALIGDHQQLTPQAINRILTEPVFALDVSLFERLVTQGMPFTVLNMQRRMIPEIRQLVNLFYPDLRDHSCVLKRDLVKGLGPALWWFDHTWAEQASAGASGHSFSNDGEADMVVEFAKYLFRCGTPVENLTILTFYTAQKELIQSKLGVQSLRSSICKTVDSFQGCENDIILLSMVRSPMPGQGAKVGFLDNIHRVTVALSRARNAFYLFGNAANVEGSATWSPILDVLCPFRHGHLPVVCPIHGTKSFVRCMQDWTIVAGDAGCRGELCESARVSDSDSSDGTLAKSAMIQVSRQQYNQQMSMKILPKAAAQLDKASLDHVDAASSHTRTQAVGDSASSTDISRDSSAQNSDYVIEVGYDVFLAENEPDTEEFRRIGEDSRTGDISQQLIHLDLLGFAASSSCETRGDEMDAWGAAGAVNGEESEDLISFD